MPSVFDQFKGSPISAPKAEPLKRSRNREVLSSTSLATGKRTLQEKVDLAFATLEDAMIYADYGNAVKAAQIVLDRSGFGPRSTVDVNSTNLDLTELSREQLAERALLLAERIRAKLNKGMDNALDVSPSKETQELAPATTLVN